jgi:hypothetical protein
MREARMTSSEKSGGESVEQLKSRLTLVSGFNDLLHLAFDALLHHGVNYKELRAYKDPTNPLMDTTPRDRWDAFQRVAHWLSKMTNDIAAAVRRKTSIREV